METEWRIARTRLRELLQDNSQASHRELAEATGYSVSWVRKWRKRLAQAPPGAEQVLNGQSHRPPICHDKLQLRWRTRLLRYA